MSYEEAVERASREEAFMATVYAMNSLLIHKGIYTSEEYRTLFVEWVQKEERKKSPRAATVAEVRASVSA